MNRINLIIFCLFWMAPVFGQSGNQMIREGNRLFKAEKFEESEGAYRQALGASRQEPVAGFNLGTALYRQERFEEAGRQFDAAAGRSVSLEKTSHAYFNLGNSLLQAGEIEKSIEAYKQALRKNPDDLSAKYNLTYARHLLKQQTEQEKQDQSEKDEDGDEENQNQQDNQQNQQQQQGEEQQQNEAGQDSKEMDEQQGQKLSREDARRLLEALAQDEKSIQEKVRKEKARANRVRTLKDW